MRNTHQNGFFRPVRDFVPAVTSCSLDIFNKLCGELEKTEDVSDLLLPFFVSTNIMVKKAATYEYAPYPGNYSYLSSVKILTSEGSVCASGNCDVIADGKCLTKEEMEDLQIKLETTYTEQPVNIVPDSKFGSATKHLTKRPKLDSPIGTKVPAGVKLLPAGVGVVMFNYYRRPKDPVFNYTIKQDGVDDILQYNQSGSQGLEWDEVLTPVFLYQLSKYYNLFIGEDLRKEVELISKALL